MVVESIFTRWKPHDDARFEDVLYSLGMAYFVVPKARNTTIKQLLLRNHYPALYGAFLNSGMNIHQFIWRHTRLSIDKSKAHKVAGDGWDQAKKVSFFSNYGIDSSARFNEFIDRILAYPDKYQKIQLRSQYKIVANKIGDIPTDIFLLSNLLSQSLQYAGKLAYLDALRPAEWGNSSHQNTLSLTKRSIEAVRHYYKRNYELLRVAQ